MLIILKLGGSVITDKKTPMKIRHDVIDRIAGEVKQYLSLNNRDRIVIVHGGGSIGHYLVKSLKVREDGWSPLKYSVIANEMLRLSLTISQAFINQGVPATIVPAHSAFQLDKSGNIIFNPTILDILKGLLENNIVPIIYGDVVLYRDNSHSFFEVLSGDNIAWFLASKLKAGKLLFATSVDGVYDRPPGKGNAKLLRQVSLLELSVDTSLSDEEYYDVTGGMKNKLKAGLKYISELKNTMILIFNGLVEGNVYRALIGKPTKYTQVKA